MNEFTTYITTAAEALGELASAQKIKVTTAESCTAGGVAYALTQVAGSSAWFDRGYITYSNEAKQQMLGVPAQRLREFGAVSEAVARAMAVGALRHSQAQLAVAVTGIAGPGGGSAEKPVGTVWFAWALQPTARSTPSVCAKRCQFEGDRAAIRTLSIIEALDGLVLLLKHQHDV